MKEKDNSRAIRFSLGCAAMVVGLMGEFFTALMCWADLFEWKDAFLVTQRAALLTALLTSVGYHLLALALYSGGWFLRQSNQPETSQNEV